MQSIKKPSSPEKVVVTACCTHCGGSCLLKVRVKEGVVTRIETDDGEGPQLRACLRGRAQRQRLYAPDRLKFPMRRVGEKGEGRFERISWDQALDTVAGEVKRISDTYGPAAIVFFGGGGDVTLLHRPWAIERLLNMVGGHTTTWGGRSYEGSLYADMATFGTRYTLNGKDDLPNSRLIILWGWDPANTIQSTNTTWYLAQAKERGARVISVDPRFTDTAATLADRWIPIRPGTDTAMLIAMAYVVITEKLQDQKFLDTYTVGFDRFRDYVLGREDSVAKTPRWAEKITEVPAATIASLAKEYAATRPAALIAGIGPGRSALGEQYHRAAIVLAAMTGNIGIHGGGAAGRIFGDYYLDCAYPLKVNIPGSGINQVEQAMPRKKNALFNEPFISSASLHRSKIPDAILEGRAGGYPADYKLLYVINNNPLNQNPNVNKWAKALKKLEFIVVQEQFMSSTAKFADILLPTNTFLERNDIVAGGGTPFYLSMSKAVGSLYESKSHLEIAAGLARRMGIANYDDKTEDEWLKEIAQGSDIPDYDTFRRKGIYRIELPEPYVAFKKEIEDPANNPFPTPSGKIEIYSQQLADMNDPLLPAVPKYIQPWESRGDALAERYPLQLVTSHFKRRAHSQFDNIPWLRELQTQAVLINPVDAEARGIKDGDEVRVFNDRGQMIIAARVSERIMPGVVDIPQGAWYNPDDKGIDRGGCTNVLSRDEPSPGGAFAFNTGLVQIQKA